MGEMGEMLTHFHIGPPAMENYPSTLWSNLIGPQKSY